MLKIAIVGAGPSGLFLTKYILKQFKDKIKIDLFEKLPTPLGLLKFGVAPDHPEVKEKFLHHFDSVFGSENVQTFLNVDLGKDISIFDISKQYNAVVLCTGMSNSKRNWLGVPGCYGADEVFGWYNSNPLTISFRQDLSKTERLVIIGNGNVALDMARIFSKKPDHFRQGTISNNVLSVLEKSKIKEVIVIGRRGLVDASFTPAELREFTDLKDYCNISIDPELKPECMGQSLTRIQQKNMDIMKALVANCTKHSAEKSINFTFSSPVAQVFMDSGQKILKIQKSDNFFEFLNFDILIECTGFYQKQKFAGIQQDHLGKFITEGYKIIDNIYSCGWSRTGPTGNIADSMLEASNCAKQLFNDLDSRTPNNLHNSI